MGLQHGNSESSDATFKERMRICANRAGNAASLSKKSGISSATMSDYINGKSDPSRSRLIDIAKSANVDISWLATGEGKQNRGMSEAKNGDTGDDFMYPENFRGKKTPTNIETPASLDLNEYISTCMVQKAASAVYAYLEQQNKKLTAEQFGNAVTLVCDLAADNGEVEASMVERLMKFKG